MNSLINLVIHKTLKILFIYQHFPLQLAFSSSAKILLFGYPDWGFSVLFPQL